MAVERDISRLTIEAQRRFFRIAKRDHGLSRKVLHIDTGIPLSTLKSWEADTAMTLSAFNRLARAGVPDHLLSLLTDPGEKHVCTNGDDDDLDELASECAGFVADKLDAERDGVVTPIEEGRLKARKRRIKALAA